MYTALREAGRDAADRGEPSWSTLGNLLQEIRFTQLWHRLDFMAEKWGVDTEDTALGAGEVLRGHPLLPLVESYTFDPLRNPVEVRKKLLDSPMADLDLKAFGYFFRLQKVDASGAATWFHRASHGHGFLLPELSRQARGFREGYQELPGLTQFLRGTSPHSPIAQAFTAVYGDPKGVAEYADLESKYADHALVQWGIGQRHMAEGRMADAIRCWKRWVEISPSGEAFRKLVGVYLDQGDEDGWRETLEACLREEDTGLFHSRVPADIANHLMSKKDFKRAEPYALMAAQVRIRVGIRLRGRV